MIDPSDTPRYGLAEAARYVRVAPTTLRSWVLGRRYKTQSGEKTWPRLIRLPAGGESRLSYANLIEAHVLRSLRTDHDVSVKAVRKALKTAEDQFAMSRLLLSPELRAAAGRVFLDTYSELIELTASGQIAIRAAFERHLERIEWGRDGAPIRLFPIYSLGDAAKRSVSLAPGVASGRPVIHRRGIRTAVIVDRLDAGESEQDIAADFELSLDEVVEAATYERAA